MCIAAFLWQAHPLYPFFLLLNRDEYRTRPTKPLEWWECGDILGGRDGLAGGTWLACSRNGRVAFVTNFREVQSLPQAKSRGELPVRFLKSKKAPLDFAKEVAKEADQYNGFNLIVAEISSKTMFYITNRPTNDSPSLVTEVSPGIHVLTNAQLDSPWPKAQRLDQSFRDLVDKNGDRELPTEEMVEKLMTNTIKDDESLLPGIYSPRREYQYSSIFVDTDTELGRYGTGSISALSVKNSGEATFSQRNLQNDEWIDNSFTFQIENNF
ncbi:transport and Golgi organization 2 homolog [Momordica charantia]|uniref:Transport and Golgi organization 2 homolog n=1 Tax=Momordica charantia TaxID=3673 RepID=A0A6J1CII2_MOMCH|nr:transport and Golgi organization 2 homolog [Momordica charantia]